MAGERRDRESVLWGWLKGAAIKMGPDEAHVRRIENQVAEGDPDVEGCVRGEHFLCELKIAEGFRADGSFKVRMEYNQAYFAHRRTRAGGRSHILIRVEGDHFLIPGHRAIELYEAKDRLTREQLDSWSLIIPRNAKPEKVLLAMAGRL